MTCAKLKVTCKITTNDGKEFFGENYCNNPQSVCPRLEGEGYAKCKDICAQSGHAETVAIQNAKDANTDLSNAVAEVFGQFYVCKDCALSLKKEGITKIIIHVS